jgi:hypothetical protein
VIVAVTVDVMTTASSFSVAKDTGGGTSVKIDNDATVVDVLGVVEKPLLSTALKLQPLKLRG